MIAVEQRKVHALVDAEGWPLGAAAHSVAIQDGDRAALIFEPIRQRNGWLGVCPDKWRLTKTDGG
jgi:hypothetical protein